MPGLRVLPLLGRSSLVILALAAVGVRPMSIWASVGPKAPGMPSIWAPVGRTPQWDLSDPGSIDDTYPHTRSSMQDPPLQHAPSNRPAMQDPPLQHAPSNRPTMQDFPLQHAPSNRPTMQDPPLQHAPSNRPTMQDLPLQHAPSNRPAMQDLPLQHAPSNRPAMQDLPLQHAPSNRPAMQDLPLQHAPSNRPAMQDISHQQTPSNQPLKQFLGHANTPSNGHPSRQSERSPRTPYSNSPFNQVSPREPFQSIGSKDPSKYRPLHWDSIIYLILDKITDRMYVGNEFELLNHQCAYHTRPVLFSWSMHIMAKVWCPGWVNLAGTAITDRIPRSIEFATRDFVRKALEAGVISEEDARPWM